MDRIQVLLYSLLFQTLLGAAMLLFAIQDIVNPPIQTSCVGNACGLPVPLPDPWSWGVLYVGLILLVESLAVWVYVRKDRKNPDRQSE